MHAGCRGCHLLGAEALPGLPEKRHAEREPLHGLLALGQPPASAVGLRLQGVSDACNALQAIPNVHREIRASRLLQDLQSS